jgi:hypothetical protein
VLHKSAPNCLAYSIACLPGEHHDAWLSDGAEKEVMVPFPASGMKAWAIGGRIYSPKSNDAEIIVPIED